MKPAICLNMIVKNETRVLGRLFDSLKDVIDYYIIVDTGSTDGTPEFIQQKMAEYAIEGEVHCHEWVNFGFNRNQALQYVYKKGFQGWALFIDADEEFACSDPLFYKQLKAGVTYRLEKHHGELRYALPNLVDVSKTRWEWRGVVHEHLQHISGPDTRQLMPDAWIIYHSGEGARSQGVSDEEKFLRDAALLETECSKHPDDARSRFYLAQSYQNAGKPELAYQHYMHRTTLSGWVEETYMAQLRAGNLAASLNKPHDEVVQALLEAHEMLPNRAEALHDLAAYHRKKEQYAEAYQYAKKAASIPTPDEGLFLNKEVYQWRILDELAVSAYWVGKYTESKTACETLLQRQQQKSIHLDEATVRRIEENLNYSLDKVSDNQIEIDPNNYSELLLGAGSRTNKDLVIEGMAQEFNNLTRLDNNKGHQPDVVWDLQQHPLPFTDNAFDEIHIYEVLEHLAQQGDYKFFFAEFTEYWRILKPGGLFLASVPARSSAWAWGDPSHTRIIQPETLMFLDQDEYDKQVGITKMSDFRYLYKAHFKAVYAKEEAGTFYFALRALK